MDIATAMPGVKGIVRRKLLHALLAGAVAGMAPGCTQTLAPLRIASHVCPGYEFLFLARAKGMLPAAQVQLLEVTSASESIHALSFGFCDGAALTLDEVLRARNKGIPLVIIAVLDVSAGADMLLAHPGIQTLQQLSGCRIAVEHSGVGALMLSRALRQGGVDARKIILHKLPPPEQEEAWRAGQVDAVVTYEPFANRLLASGAHRLFDTRMIPDTVIDVLAVHADALRRHPEAARSLVAAHFQALDYWRRNPTDSNPLLAARLSVPEFAVAYQFNEINLPDRAENRRWLDGTTSPITALAQELLQLMHTEHLISSDLQLADLARSDFLPAPAP